MKADLNTKKMHMLDTPQPYLVNVFNLQPYFKETQYFMYEIYISLMLDITDNWKQ